MAPLVAAAKRTGGVGLLRPGGGVPISGKPLEELGKCCP